MYNPGTHANHWTKEKLANFNDAAMGDMFMSKDMIDQAQNFPFHGWPGRF
jgi:3-oxoacyl-[acyl-carrier-protein] synthase-3